MTELADFMLYHRAVRDVRGEHLMPLSDLRVAFPDVYERENRKYLGREQLRAERVLPLDCLWGDVLFLSPVHPAVLLDAVRESGRKVPKVRFWAVNASVLTPERACVKFVRPWPNGVYEPYTAEDYASFDVDTLQVISEPSDTTLQRLRTLPQEAPLILWSDVPHVLYRGHLPISMFSEIYA